MAKRIEIVKQGDTIIWLAEENAGYNTEVSVAEGCQAMVLCDGAIVDHLYGGVKKINVKGLFGKPDGGRWSVYGIDVSEVIELRWGGQIKYNDKEYGIVSAIKMSGEALAKTENAGKLFRALDCSKKEEITKDGLVELFRGTMMDEAERAAARVIGDSAGGVLTDVREKISAAMKAELKKKFGDEYGLCVTEVRVRINGYDQKLEELWELKRQAAEARLRKEISESAGAGIRSIAEGVSAFGDKARPAEADSIDFRNIGR